MEVYILDTLLRRIQVVDKFESLIWTERFAAVGDFELALFSTAEVRGQFVTGVYLAMNESYRVMVVETVEDDIDDTGKHILHIKGRSLEMLLMNRVAKDTMSNTTTEPTWHLTGTPAAIARQIYYDICVTGNLDVKDIIPFYQYGTIFGGDTIPEPPTSITLDLEPTTVYDAIKQLCDLYDMGFRLVREFDMSRLYFNIYMGVNRTTAQSTDPAVVFSPRLDNLQNTTELTTIEEAKNVAYVFSPAGFVVVYADGVDPAVAGLDRRVLLVNATDITNPTGATAALTQRGTEALKANRGFSAFDGEISQHSQYKYGTHYNLGDLVEVQNTDGFTNNMQVTEQIFVSDAQGERSYPTLAINLSIMPGTWLSWDFNQHWLDLNSSMTAWADQV
jgi:Siphovirus ReqiPepy6 Gp37-like protein